LFTLQVDPSVQVWPFGVVAVFVSEGVKPFAARVKVIPEPAVNPDSVQSASHALPDASTVSRQLWP
jgi:hypothetical protein